MIFKEIRSIISDFSSGNFLSKNGLSSKDIGLLRQYVSLMQSTTRKRKAFRQTIALGSQALRDQTIACRGSHDAMLALASSEEKTLLATRALSAATKVGIVAALSAIAYFTYEFVKVSDDIANKAKEIGSSYKDASNSLSSYKSRTEELLNIINDENSSIEEVTKARSELLDIRNALIDSYGKEPSLLNDIITATDGVTTSVNNMGAAYDRILQKEWKKKLIEFNDNAEGETGIKGFFKRWIKDSSNALSNYKDNIARMEDEYGHFGIQFDVDAANITKERDKFIKLLTNEFGAGVAEYSDVPIARLSGTADEVYEKLLKIQELSEDYGFSDQFNSKISELLTNASNTIDKYGDFWDQYVFNEKIMTDSNYTDYYKKLDDIYNGYQNALKNGSKELADTYKSQFLDVFNNLEINEEDVGVKEFFDKLFPDLQTDAFNYQVKVNLDPTISQNKETETKVKNAAHRLGEIYTAEMLKQLNLDNVDGAYSGALATLQTIAEDLGINPNDLSSWSKFIDLISELGYVSKYTKKDVENLVNTIFGELQTELAKISNKGNTDLFNRKKVSASKMIEAGYTDFNPGDYATTYTDTRTIKDAKGNDVVINVTPILPDGRVLSEESMNWYLDNVINGARDVLAADKEKLIISAEIVTEDNVDDVVNKMSKEAQNAHVLQELFYDSSFTDETIEWANNSDDAAQSLEAFLRAIKDSEQRADVLNRLIYQISNNGGNAVRAFTFIANELKRASDNAKGITVSNAVSDITSMSDGFKILETIYKDVQDKGTFNFDNLDPNKLKETFKGAEEEVDKFIKTVAETPDNIDACQQAFNNLVSSWNSLDSILSKVNADTAKSIENMLTEKGITNASELVQQQLSVIQELETAYEDVTVKEAAVAAAEQDVANSAEGVSSSVRSASEGLLEEADMSEETKRQLFDLVAAQTVFSNQGLSVQDKINALQKLAEAYFGTAQAASLANSMMSGLGNTGADYIVTQTGNQAPTIVKNNNKGMTPEKAYQNWLNDLKNKDYGIANYTGGSSGSKGGGSKGSGSSSDPLKEIGSYISSALDKQISAINEQKSAAINALKEQQKAAIKAVQAQIKALEEQKKALQDEIDKINEANEARSRSLALQTALYELDRMQNQRTLYVYSEEQGMHYSADTQGKIYALTYSNVWLYFINTIVSSYIG